MYSIIDVETTGGAGAKDKITEIAVYVYDGQKIVDEFVSLINPECHIPHFITQITGISNDMVVDAPKFYEVAKRIATMTENTIFVAHNAEFDYGFVKSEFKRLGYNYRRKRLCTVKLARKILPGHSSYSLGKICADLHIKINGRHRAGGDAYATVQLFSKIMQANGDGLLTDAKLWVNELPPALSRHRVQQLPEEPGVYYFHDSTGKVIYVGKSVNIYTRVLTHLSTVGNKRVSSMKSNIADITYQLTGNNLIACLLESAEIKRLQPFYNRMQRRNLHNFALQAAYDSQGYINLSVAKTSKTTEALVAFGTLAEGREYLEKITETFHLCQKLNGLYKTDGPCFQYLVKKCAGACCAEETAEAYNVRANAFIRTLRYLENNCLIQEAGREPDEIALIGIRGGRYMGFGFFDVQEVPYTTEEIFESLTRYDDNRDTKSILNGYLARPAGKIIKRF